MAAQYSSGRDYTSAAKLNYFHYVLKQLMGYTLHPSIVTDRTCPLQAIADLGTQTAIWPIDIAETHPDVEIDAFDLSDRFAPPPAWRPNNVHIHIHDILMPFAPELREKYDVVHFRLFLTLSTSQLSTMLANAVTLLKPGGYVQWTEHNKTNQRAEAADPHLSTDAVDAFIQLQQHPFPHYNAGWVLEISQAMSAAGLDIIAEENVPTRPSMLPQFHELHLLSLADVAPGLSPAVDAFKLRWLDHLTADHHRGVACLDAFLCVVARKPL